MVIHTVDSTNHGSSYSFSHSFFHQRSTSHHIPPIQFFGTVHFAFVIFNIYLMSTFVWIVDNIMLWCVVFYSWQYYIVRGIQVPLPTPRFWCCDSHSSTMPLPSTNCTRGLLLLFTNSWFSFFIFFSFFVHQPRRPCLWFVVLHCSNFSMAQISVDEKGCYSVERNKNDDTDRTLPVERNKSSWYLSLKTSHHRTVRYVCMYGTVP